jgi:hypothetical protein
MDAIYEMVASPSRRGRSICPGRLVRATISLGYKYSFTVTREQCRVKDKSTLAIDSEIASTVSLVNGGQTRLAEPVTSKSRASKISAIPVVRGS